ncbi:MAG: thioredoxin family protein [Candidatus Falkowbacteria bacterium]
MIIQVIGTGCPNCKKLLALTQQAVDDLAINMEVKYVTDMEEIARLGIMSVPALVVDNKVIMSGHVPDAKKIKELIQGSQSLKAVGHCDCCCGGGEC